MNEENKYPDLDRQADVDKAYKENPVVLIDDDEMNRAVEDLTDSYNKAEGVRPPVVNEKLIKEDWKNFTDLKDEQAPLSPAPERPTEVIMNLYKLLNWSPSSKVEAACKRLDALFDKEGFDMEQYQRGIEAEIGLLKDKQAKSDNAIIADKRAMEDAGKQQGAYRKAQIKKYHFSNDDWHRLDELTAELAILDGSTRKYLSDRVDYRAGDC